MWIVLSTELKNISNFKPYVIIQDTHNTYITSVTQSINIILYVIQYSAHAKVMQAKFVCPNFRPCDLSRFPLQNVGDISFEMPIFS